MGYKPACDTILEITRAGPAGGRDVTTRLGLAYVYFDSLQNGYGLAARGLHSRDHEGYFYWFYDSYGNSPYTNASGERWLLITPTGLHSKGGEGIYRLELYIPDYNLYQGMKKPGAYHHFVGTVGAPTESEDGRLRLSVREVEIISRDSPRIRARLSGTIVADKDAPWEFEYRLKEWNGAIGRAKENHAYP